MFLTIKLNDRIVMMKIKYEVKNQSESIKQKSSGKKKKLNWGPYLGLVYRAKVLSEVSSTRRGFPWSNYRNNKPKIGASS